MSDFEKPYQAPATSGELQSGTEATNGITANTRDFIGQAAPWITFLAIMGFIGCGFMVLGGIAMMVMGALPGMGSAFMVGPLLGLFYIALALLMFFPSLFALRMGQAGRQYKLGGAPSNLEGLALNLRKYAKFNGILYIIGMGVAVLAIIGSIVVGIIGVMSR